MASTVSDQRFAGNDDSGDDHVVYDLSDWTAEQRAQLDRVLSGEGLAWRWDVADAAHPLADQLVVAEACADQVEELIDEVDHPDALEVDDAADDGGAEVLSELYLASDVLIAAPTNEAAAVEAQRAAQLAATMVAPYGLDDRTWADVRRRSATLAEVLAGGHEPSVVGAAHALREAVRPLV